MPATAFIVSLLCLAASYSASATEAWVEIPNNDPAITFWLDKNSVKWRGEWVSVWEKIVYEQPKIKDEASGKLVKEKKVHRLMHCTDHTQGVLFGATYAENGRFISSVSYDEKQIQMSPIPTGTLAAEQLRLVCLAAQMQQR